MARKYSSGWLGSLQLPVVVLAIVIIALVSIFFYYDSVPERTISIRARTQQITAHFAARTDWLLPHAALCEARLPSRSTRDGASAVVDAPCGNTERKLGEGQLSLTWPSGARGVMRRLGTGPIEILLSSPMSVEPGEATIGDASGSAPTISLQTTQQRIAGHERQRIVIREDALAMIGSLRLAGPVVIGDQAPSPDILVEGHYEIREPLRWRGDKLTTDSGALVLGDTVSIVDRERRPIPVSGFLTIVDREVSGFDVVAVDAKLEGGDEQLKLARVGYQDAYLTPHWTERAVADKAFVVLAAVIAAISAAFSIAGETISIATQAKARRDKIVSRAASEGILRQGQSETRKAEAEVSWHESAAGTRARRDAELLRRFVG